jgi:hypothetical protein
MLEQFDEANGEYPSIIALEELGLKATEIADSVVCKFGLTRETYNGFVSSIGEAFDVEWLVSLGYVSTSTTKFI